MPAALTEIRRRREEDALIQAVRTASGVLTNDQIRLIVNALAGRDAATSLRDWLDLTTPEDQRVGILLQGMMPEGAYLDDQGGAVVLAAALSVTQNNGRFTEAQLREAAQSIGLSPDDTSGFLGALEQFGASTDGAVSLAIAGNMLARYALPVIERVAPSLVTDPRARALILGATIIGGILGAATDEDLADRQPARPAVRGSVPSLPPGARPAGASGVIE